MSDPDRYYPADEDRAGYEMPDPRPGEDDVDGWPHVRKESAEEMLDRAYYLSGTLSETPEKDQAALRFVLSTRAELLKACRLAFGAFERNGAIDWSTLEEAIAKAEGK